MAIGDAGAGDGGGAKDGGGEAGTKVVTKVAPDGGAKPAPKAAP